MNERQETWRVHRWGGHPVFATPIARAVRRGAWNHFPVYSAKTALARGVLRAGDRLGLTSLLLHRDQAPLAGMGVDANAWLRDLRRYVPRAAAMALAWPPRARSVHRVYGYLLDDRGACVGFVKLATSPPEVAKVRNEGSALSRLSEMLLARCAVPRLLGEGVVGDARHAYVVTDPIPADAGRVDVGETSWADFAGACKAEFAGATREITRDRLTSQPWWPAVAALPRQFPALASQLSDGGATAEPVALGVCRTHGDFLGHNMRRTPDGRTWIFDWEEFAEEGPHLTDEIAFFFNAHRARFASDMRAAAGRFAEAFLPRDDADGAARRRDVLAALAVLHGSRIGWAGEILRSWPAMRR